MTKINFDPDQDISYTKIYGGNVDINGKIYPFTLTETYTANIGDTQYNIDWVEGVPENNRELEKQIVEEHSP